MSDAQKDILKMLADGVINVDEAERLLKAVSEGEKHREEPRSRPRPHPHPPLGGIFEAIGETLADIGPMVKTTVEDVMTGVLGDELGDLDEEELEDVEPTDGTFSVKEGKHLLIVNDWLCGYGKTDLQVQGVAGDTCRIESEKEDNVRVRQDASHVIIQWADGPLTVEVPDTIASLRIKMKGGNIQVKEIGCQMNLKTLGGNVDIHDVQQDFHAKTMGGQVKVALAQGWQGNGRTHTMGGDITLSIPEDVSLKVKAVTMGGKVNTEADSRILESKQSFPGKSKVKLQVGEESDSFVVLKTMGGDINVRRSRHESA